MIWTLATTRSDTTPAIDTVLEVAPIGGAVSSAGGPVLVGLGLFEGELLELFGELA
jgi:hypothetical protein